MKITKYLFFTCLVLAFVPLRFFAQDDMAPPKPLDNKVYKSMVGQWTGESDMMGMKMKQDFNIYWNIGHQYIFMDVKMVSTTDPNTTYTGLGIFGADKDGKAKGWWFDNWGASMVSTGDGTFDGNKLTLNDGNAMFSETRVFEVNGSEMTMSAKGTMKMNGKDMPFDEKTVYKKK